ncbi:uncharacterized protein LOC124172133 [Ischnura elegans]|uniref:uncharacterized protein LOC124172133 n=1 Tax=Ischnura elegans TaxID=197161 RepID=UPI001ED89301|nr:uncharacterized protein LOC124172133 [Ischnura elegans]
MPKLKQPSKLESISIKLVAKYFQASFTHIESLKCEGGNQEDVISKELLTDVESLLDGIPGPILEVVLIEVIHQLLEKITSRKTTKGLIVALDALLRPSLKSVDLGKLFYGARLSRKISQPCEVLLPKKLMLMKNLCELDLISRCTDDILLTLARCCTSLRKLDISYSDLVTDVGLRFLCGVTDNKETENNDGPLTGCKEIEWLGLQKLWETTVDGVIVVVESMPKLKYLRYDQLGEIFLRKLNGNQSSCSLSKMPKICKEYGLTLFDQTYNVFTPSESLVRFIADCCPNLRTLQVYSPDKYLPSFGIWKSIENFALEIDGVCGQGLIGYFECIGLNLVVINISFDSLESRHLKALGKCCLNVKELTLMGSEINENEFLKNEKYFTKMEVFNMSIWCDEGITGSLLLYFFSYSGELRELSLSASAGFLNDNFFQNQILAKCPCFKIEVISIFGNPRVPLTIKTARRLLRLCPNLKKISLSRWRVPEAAIKDLQEEMKSSNYDILII